MAREYPVAKLVEELEKDNLLPGILFRTSRRQCDEDITDLAQARIGTVSDKRQEELRGEVQRVIDKYGLEREVISEHEHYPSLIRTGTGARWMRIVGARPAAVTAPQPEGSDPVRRRRRRHQWPAGTRRVLEWC